MLTFDIPVAPSVNHAYRHGQGRVYMTDKAFCFKQIAGYRAVEAASVSPPFSLQPGPLKITLVVWFGDRRRRDLDNILKLTLDAIASALGFDDSLIDEILIVRSLDRANPRVSVTLEALPYEQPQPTPHRRAA